MKPSWIIIHHSATRDGTGHDWESIRRYHMSYRYQGEIITEGVYEALLAQGKVQGLEKPWANIGYNEGIEEVDGVLTVQKGRLIGDAGAHCMGFNDRSIGICVVGNYDKIAPSEAKLSLLASIVREHQRQFNIPPDQVIGHRESYALCTPPQPVAKTCPGAAFDMDDFRCRLLNIKAV